MSQCDVIDKNKTEYDSYKAVIKKDPHCWEHGVVGGTQTKCHLLLYNFYIKKTWVENLLPKVGENERDELYNVMCTLMDVESEIELEDNYNTFKVDYRHLTVVMRYVDVGWAGQNCYCRTMWTRFRRLFPHGFIDTINFVERMWHFIKYTLLRRKIIYIIHVISYWYK